MPLEIQDIITRKESRKRALEEALESITRQLASLGAVKVLVFGSVAEGHIRNSSDLDIIAVMPPTRSGKEWRRLVSETVDREISCDLLVYTEEELEKNLPASSFLRHALQTGKVVYEKRP